MSLEAIRMLREQQSQVKEGSPQWMVAEQLMDICRAEPESAELIAQDLGVEAMSITEAEKKLDSPRVLFGAFHSWLDSKFPCWLGSRPVRLGDPPYGRPHRRSRGNTFACLTLPHTLSRRPCTCRYLREGGRPFGPFSASSHLPLYSEPDGRPDNTMRVGRHQRQRRTGGRYGALQQQPSEQSPQLHAKRVSDC